MILEKIKKQLALLTTGFSNEDKIKFLKTIGYKSFSEIQSLNDEQREDLLRHLMSKEKSEYEIVEMKGRMSGYTISRPKNPKNVKDIGFNFHGLKGKGH